MSRVLVLGATGHIGSHIVRALLKDGHNVRASFRRNKFLNVLDGLDVEKVRVDLDSLDGLRSALHGCEWVFHAASYYPSTKVGRDEAIEHGVQQSRKVIELIRDANPERVVFTSSAATIRSVEGKLSTEEDAESWPLKEWRTLYATLKIAIEQEVLSACKAGFPAVVVNPSVCLGEYDSRPFSGRYILLFAKYKVPFYLDHWLNAVYTGDVGVGHVLAASKGRLGERYLLTTEPISLLELAKMVAAVTGTTPPRFKVPFPAAVFAAGIMKLAARRGTEPWITPDVVRSSRKVRKLDGSKAHKELGVPQTSIYEAVERAVGWFKQNGYIASVKDK